MWRTLGFFIWILYLSCDAKMKKSKVLKCECGVTANWNNRIVGGFEARPNEFPWLVVITYNDVLHCGGSIINDLYILTAGHCIKWYSRTDLMVITGVHDIRKEKVEGISYRVAEMILNPRFYSYKIYDDNDIALLRLERPIHFTDVARPVCLPNPTMPEYYGRLGIIAGWGRVETNGRLATNLKEAFVKILTPAECANTSMRLFAKPTVYCAFSYNTDTCQGDSGGPLILETEPGKMTQLGLVSWGFGCAQDSPGMYTKIVKYLDWIYEVTMNSNFCRND